MFAADTCAECGAEADQPSERLIELEAREAVLEAALRCGVITLSSQDRDLRYTWIYAPHALDQLEFDGDPKGLRDDDLLPAPAAARLMAAKRVVIDEAAGARLDLEIATERWRRWFDVMIEPLLDPSGTVAGVTTVSVDITDRIRAEEELRRSRAQLAEAELIAQMGSWEWDIPSNTVRWSDGLFAIYGLDPAEFPGYYEQGSERIHPDDRARADGAVRRALETGESIDIEYRIIRPDGRIRVLRGLAELIADADGEPLRLAGTVHDVTDLRAAERALRETATELGRRSEELQRLAREDDRGRGDPERFLSARQLEVLALVAEGLSNADIADRLFLSESTVKWHVRQILQKLGVANRAQAVARYLGRPRPVG